MICLQIKGRKPTFEMNEVENTCKLIPFEGKGHGFFNGSYFRPRKTDEIFNILMDASIVFLKDHLQK